MGLMQSAARLAWLVVVAAGCALVPPSASGTDIDYKLQNRSGPGALLLEARNGGRTTPESFTGTAAWERGEADGLPIIVGRARFPFQGIGVTFRIRLNVDKSLPASHLIEIDFAVAGSFAGETVDGVPGILFKNEELEQGTPLNGASARVMTNTFLFAIAGNADEGDAGVRQLVEHDYIDLALIYGTGKRAIVTIRKDREATKLFESVFREWDDPRLLERQVLRVKDGS